MVHASDDSAFLCIFGFPNQRFSFLFAAAVDVDVAIAVVGCCGLSSCLKAFGAISQAFLEAPQRTQERSALSWS